MFMSARKVQLNSKTKEKPRRSLLTFLRGVRHEMKLVTWTNKDELKLYTNVVLGTTFFFGMLIYFFDVVIQYTLQGINIITKVFGG